MVTMVLTRKNVSTSISEITPSMNLREKPCVVPFLYYYKCHWG